MTNFGPFDAELVEAEFTHDNATLPSDIRGVEVYAIGGGTVGQYYANNNWAYRVHFNNNRTREGTDLHMPSATTHREAAELAARLLSKEF